MSAGSSSEAGLIAAVAADFDADLPRLVLADYYDDHGKAPLARFIRAQLAVASSPPGHAHYVDALEEQALALAGVRGAALLPAPELPEGFTFVGSVDELEADGVGAYQRGFAGRATVSGLRFSGAASAMARATERVLRATLVREVGLDRVGLGLGEVLLAAPHGREWRGVVIGGSRPDIDVQVERLASDCASGSLRRLELTSPLWATLAEQLGRAEFPELREFSARTNIYFDLPEWNLLAQSPWLHRLESLTIPPRISDDFGLVAAAFGPSLHTLECFIYLVGFGPTLPTPVGLRRLIITVASPTGDTARQLARWPLPPLTSFVLNRCTLTQPALAALADAPWLHSVEELALTDCTFDADHLPVLLARLTPGRLRKLHLRGAELTRAAFEWLATSEVTQSLTTLDVRGARPAKSRGHAGPVAPGYLAQHFAKNWRGHRLRALLMDHWSVGTAAAKALAGNPRLASLRRLSLRGCRLGDSSGAMLLSSPHLQGVEEWGLARNALGSATAACLLTGGCAVLAGLVDLGDNKLRPDERARLRALRAGVWA